MRSAITTLFTICLFLGAGLAHAGWEEGVAAYKSGNYSQAVKEITAVVEAQPDFAGGHFLLGNSLLKLDKKQDALNHLRKAYELDSSQVSYQLALGQAYLENGRYKESVQVLQKINSASLPKSQQAAYDQMMAVALSKSGDSGKALDALRKVAESNPGSAAAWYSYGTAAFNADQIDTACTALEKAVRLDSNDAKKQETYVKALIAKARRTNNASQKKAAYAKAIPTAQSLAASNRFEHLLTLGEIQLGAKQFREAAATLEKAVARKSSDFYGHFYLSQVYTSLANWSKVENSAKKALDLASGDREKKLVWRQIGFAKEKMKQYDEAKVAYRNAGDMNGLRRVEENERIAQENAEADRHNQEIEQLAKEQEEVERQLKELQGGPPPR